jgi:threonine synthase
VADPDEQPDGQLDGQRDASTARRGLWRHAARLPLRAPELTLGEGDTPLVHLPRWGAAHGLERVFAKLELVNPTGSFKDRGMAALVAIAVQAGARRLVEDSSGNAGAAAAAYAARAGLSCTVYAPAAAPEAKLRQIRAYGAELVLVPGPRSAVSDAARRAGAAPGVYHVAHNENPAFVLGNKTFAYELSEAWRDGQLLVSGQGAASRNWHVVIPTGGGALLCGAWQGFLDDEAAGRLAGAGRPRLHAAQTVACAPLARAWEQGLDEPAPVERAPSVCGGIEIERPPRGRAILAALRESGGSAVAAQEHEILAERDRLARLEGIYAEPTSAAALAGLAELARRGRVGAGEVVVVAITGSGLKDPGPLGQG